MTIKERIARISPYFKEMQIVPLEGGEQVVYVVVSFPHGWVIDEEIESKFNVTISNGELIDQYYFCATIDEGTDVVFDAIEYNIDKMKEAIERAQLLNEKIKEIKETFENEEIPIEKLRTMKFSFADDKVAEIIVPKRGKKEEKPQAENNEEVKEAVQE